jgi:LPS export ABC transporter protein LptC
MHPSAVKIIRRILIGLIVVVASAVLLNTLQIWRRESGASKNPPAMLHADFTRAAESIEYSENKDGIVRFKIRAQRLRETRLGKSLLEGIEAYDFNADGSIHNSIRSREAAYDRNNRLIDFFGDVRLYLGEKIELQTASLHYDMNANVGTTAEMVRFNSRDISGGALGVRFDRNQELLELQSQVHFELNPKNNLSGTAPRKEKIRASSERALCYFASNQIVFKGKARMEAEKSGILSGEKIDIYLSSDRKRITAINAAGAALYQFRDDNESRTLGGDALVFQIGSSGSLEKIILSGRAKLDSKSSAQEEGLEASEIQILLAPSTSSITEIQAQRSVRFRMKRAEEETLVSGEKLMTSFNPETKLLKSVTVSQKAELLTTGGKNQSLTNLRGDEIRVRLHEESGRALIENLQADGFVQWTVTAQQKSGTLPQQSAQPERTLNASRLEISYSDGGNYPKLGKASGKVVIAESVRNASANLQMRRLSADFVQFYFFPQSSQPKEINAAGHVQMFHERIASASGGPLAEKLQTFSDNMRALFTLKDGTGMLASASQWGHFKYKDASYSATAERCDYDATAEILALKGSPWISDERSSTTGERMEYSQRKRELVVYGKVRSVLIAQNEQGSFFQPSESSAPAIVISDEMRYWVEKRRIRYSGKVQALSENQQLQAQMLEIQNNGERMEAQGEVHHLLFPKETSRTASKGTRSKESADLRGAATRIQSARLEYIRMKNELIYSEKVALETGDLNLTADTLNVVLGQNGKNVERATARGNVLLYQGERKCIGDTAEYYPDSGKFVVLGNPAEIHDPDRGRSFARRLTYIRADDRILLEKQ